MLLKDLAEYILLELTSCYQLLCKDWIAETIKSLKDSINLLMETAEENGNYENNKTMLSGALLSQFLTNTENVKAGCNQKH